VKVNVSFLGPIRRPWPEQTRELEVAKDTSIIQLLETLGYQAQDMRRVAIVVNEQKASLEKILKDGDQLRLVLLAGGG
jgi:sulfur carrier protein ThiS